MQKCLGFRCPRWLKPIMVLDTRGKCWRFPGSHKAHHTDQVICLSWSEGWTSSNGPWWWNPHILGLRFLAWWVKMETPRRGCWCFLLDMPVLDRSRDKETCLCHHWKTYLWLPWRSSILIISVPRCWGFYEGNPSIGFSLWSSWFGFFDSYIRVKWLQFGGLRTIKHLAWVWDMRFKDLGIFKTYEIPIEC